MLPYSLTITIFLGVFLLFQVQPLIGKYILPWFGGGAGAVDDLPAVFSGDVAGGLSVHDRTRTFPQGLQLPLNSIARWALHVVRLSYCQSNSFLIKIGPYKRKDQ